MTSRSRRRVFYIAPLAIDPRYRHLESPAARNKVLGVASAVRAGGATPIIVTSTGTHRTSIGRLLHVERRNGTCFVEVFSFGGGIVRRTSSLFFLLWFAWCLVRREDRVLLYNSYPDLLLVAAWLRLRGRPCILDLEDAPRPDDTGSLGRLINIVFPLFRKLCAKPMVVASAKLAEQIGIQNFLPVYGVSSFFAPRLSNSPRFSQDAIKVIFGGTITHDTGSTLFDKAMRILTSRQIPYPLHIYVTGKFEKDLFSSLKIDVAENSKLSLFIAQDLDTESYATLLSNMDVGLCLKLASSDTGQTTFPSKVIEISALGMLLVSTRVSDVPLIFDNDSAVLLESESPNELAEALIDIAADRGRARHRAIVGNAIVKNRFSAANVGADLVAFLDQTSVNS